MKRSCGECTLCCKLLPVPEFGKMANTKCQHQRSHKGCAIYSKRPLSCQFWSCGWLAWDDAGGLSRPDRVHYVIDIMPDYISIQDDYSPERPTQVPVIQVWLDPKYPDAHRDPALRALINSRSEKEGCAALIRTGTEQSAIILFPPALTGDGEWHERESNVKVEQHRFDEIISVLADR
jgi:hypothetical protein